MKFYIFGTLFLSQIAAVIMIAGWLQAGTLPLWGFAMMALPVTVAAWSAKKINLTLKGETKN